MTMPMHFGTYMNPQPVPQFHQFSHVGNAENAQFPNMQPVGQNYNSDVNSILGRHYTIPGTAPSFSHEQVLPILVPAQQTQTEHVQRPLDALLQAAEMHAAVDKIAEKAVQTIAVIIVLSFIDKETFQTLLKYFIK